MPNTLDELKKIAGIPDSQEKPAEYIPPDDPFMKRKEESKHGSPMIKLGIICGVVGVFFVLILMMIASFSKNNPATAKASRRTPKSSEIEKQEEDPMARLKTQAALSRQAGKLSDLKNIDSPEEEKKKPPHPEKKTPKIRVIPNKTTSAPINRIPAPPVQVVPPKPKAPSPTPKAQPKISKPPAQPVTPKKVKVERPVDPNQLYAQLQNMGSYSMGALESDLFIPTEAGADQFNEADEQESSPPIALMPSGTTAQAQLMTPIFWGEGQSSPIPVILKMDESFGPHAAGSTVKANAIGDDAGFIRIQMDDIGTVLATTKKDKPLKASRKGRSDPFFNVLLSGGLKGVSRMSGLFNRPSQSSTLNSGSVVSSVVTNDREDPLAAIAEGATDEISKYFSSQLGSNNRSEYFLLKPGKTVKLTYWGVQ